MNVNLNKQMSELVASFVYFRVYFIDIFFHVFMYLFIYLVFAKTAFHICVLLVLLPLLPPCHTFGVETSGRWFLWWQNVMCTTFRISVQRQKYLIDMTKSICIQESNTLIHCILIQLLILLNVSVHDFLVREKPWSRPSSVKPLSSRSWSPPRPTRGCLGITVKSPGRRVRGGFTLEHNRMESFCKLL